MNARFSYASLLALALPLVATTGCAKAAAQPSPNVGGPSEASITSRAVTTEKVSDDLGVSSDILAACNIDIGNVTTAPKFDFDRSALTPSDSSVLAQVAACVTTGPLKGRSLALVGRADSRGTSEYNMTLGAERAGGVRVYLASLGVPGYRLQETSRGALDATGTETAGWQRDRRVDILLER